jgi:hypothetical protein
VRAPGITGDIRHGSGTVEAMLAAGIMTVGTDAATPTDAATLVVIMAAMLTPTADSMAGRLSMEASTTAAAASTAVGVTAADAGSSRMIHKQEWPAANCRPFAF